jgi:hypothetical protein
MLPHDEEWLSDEALREASIEQLVHLRARVNLALQMRAEQEGIQIPLEEQSSGQPRPGESTERPATD